jgi:hypothetical protein
MLHLYRETKEKINVQDEVCLRCRNQVINSSSFRVSKKGKVKVHVVPSCNFPSPVGHFIF